MSNPNVLFAFLVLAVLLVIGGNVSQSIQPKHRGKVVAACIGVAIVAVVYWFVLR